MSRRVALGLLGLAAIAVLAVAIAVAVVVSDVRRPYAGWDGAAVTVEIARGESAATVLERLHGAGVLAHPRRVSLWLRWTGGADALHAGEYRFDAPASPREVLGRILRGEVVLHEVTVPEGLVLGEIAERYARAGFGPVEDLVAAFLDPEAISDLDPVAPDLEGYLYPETYRFPKGTAPETIAAAMVGRFREVAGNDLARRAAAVGLSAREAVTLASMIEKETSLPEERGRIARVFHNRIERGMKMQCDPTVRYALRREGHEVGRLSRADLRFPSPWNTYVSEGLPPGPICSPGGASLEAALSPEPGDDLYFVASPDGGHVFSRTLDAHLRAVRAWRSYVRSSR